MAVICIAMKKHNIVKKYESMFMTILLRKSYDNTTYLLYKLNTTVTNNRGLRKC